MKNCAVILAGGEGTRMKSAKPKVMSEVLFKPMLDWVICAVKKAGIDDICVVTGYAAEYIERHLSEDIKTVHQAERKGTGHAVMQAADFIKAHEGANVIVLNGDAPFVDADTISDALAYHKENGNCATVISAKVKDSFGYGRIVRDEKGNIKAIVEENDADEQTKLIKEINSGAYCFSADALSDVLNKITPNNAKGEYYITDAISIILSGNGKAGAYTAGNEKTVLGANSRAQLNQLNELARAEILQKHMENGVDIPCTDGVMIGPDCVIGKDTQILPGTIMCGNVEIGENCVIGPNSYVQNSTIGDNVSFNNAQIRNAKVLDNATIGPFVQIRPDSVIGNGVHLGNFVEVKNSTIDSDTSVSHLTYVGDSDVGKNVNFGCGVVTVNFNGKTKNRTVIKDRAFIGCNTNLVAPVTVGENAYTAAGSTVTQDVPDNSLAIARERQTVKEGWVKEKQPYRKKV
ncbi:MAG: bifunctional UDP-N-acetylglucosamine diphosphorylase/glucosamine-1-phosphate N-acetyltransferase GlmU [Clostridia bacterium]|nr:bifunctional UDP-N-acetylglucosamine diphosphorylase/glucosamine-1-phosphate N-acetyltransferase GlmU [Clostridia bacterium]